MLMMSRGDTIFLVSVNFRERRITCYWCRAEVNRNKLIEKKHFSLKIERFFHVNI